MLSLEDYLLTTVNDPRWNWLELSRNVHLSEEFIRMHPELPWVQRGLDLRIGRPLELISKKLNKKDEEIVMTNCRCTIDQALERFPRNRVKKYLAGNPHIPMSEIVRRTDIPWYRNHLSSHPELSLQLIQHPPAHFSGPTHFGIGWLDHLLLSHPNFTLADLQASEIEHAVEDEDLSRNPNVTLEIIQANPHLFRNYKYLSLNPNLTLSFIQTHPGKWHGPSLVINPGLPLDYFLEQDSQLVQKCRNSPALYQHPDLTLERIQRHSQIDWNYQLISRYVGYRHPKLQAATQAQKQPTSYLSFLPTDMFSHYFAQYLRE